MLFYLCRIFDDGKNIRMGTVRGVMMRKKVVRQSLSEQAYALIIDKILINENDRTAACARFRNEPERAAVLFPFPYENSSEPFYRFPMKTLKIVHHFIVQLKIRWD